MKCRLVNMATELMAVLGICLGSVWNVKKIEIVESGRKYPREAKWICCAHPDTGKAIRFLWYEVEILNN